ncbi:hypothetical protein ACF0H5_023500 [Mactra antiquata]
MTYIVDITNLVAFKKLFASKSDDWVDKMNHKYTVIILLILATVITTAQAVGDPIFCWVPAEFTNSYEAYTKWYCWIKNTYFVPISDTIPLDVDIRSNEEITYYQWVPMILLFMAFLFKLPNLMWFMLNTHTGFNLRRMTGLADKAMLAKKEERKETINNMAIFMEMWLKSQHYYEHNFVTRTKAKVSNVLCFVCNKRQGKFLTALYFNMKSLYVINVIGQFYLLNGFLGMDYNSLGYSVLEGLTESENWRESPRFPRVTLCDFKIRQMQNILRFTVQCVLPINLFNEKVFIFLWFWYFFIAVLSCYNLFKWFLILVLKKNNYLFIKKYLKLASKVKTEPEKKLCRKFADRYLRDDGCFVLRILATNSSELIVLDLVEELWSNYKERQEYSTTVSQQVQDSYPNVPYIDE